MAPLLDFITGHWLGNLAVGKMRGFEDERELTAFVQTLESPGILLFRIPGRVSPGKGIGPVKPWKSPGILKQMSLNFEFLVY